MSAHGTYRAQGLVLRRTKLGETDLIVTLLCEGLDRQVRAVAKGARRPGSRLAGVVDLGNEGAFLLSRGRSLDVVSEGRLLVSRAGLAADPERSACAAAVLDVAAGLTDEGDPDARLYPMARAALDALAEAAPGRLAAVVAAFALKAACAQGFRPELGRCVRCGEPVGLEEAAAQGAPAPGAPAPRPAVPGIAAADAAAQGAPAPGAAVPSPGAPPPAAPPPAAPPSSVPPPAVPPTPAALSPTVPFDFLEGGTVCRACADAGSARPVDARVLLWARALIGARFADILAWEPAPGEGRLWHDVLAFSAAWLEHYPGIRPRALAFLLSGALW